MAYRAGNLTPPGLLSFSILDDADVRAAALEHLGAIPHGSLEDLRLEHAGTPDGASAVVTLSAWWRPPVLTVFVPGGIRLEVSSTARSVFR